MESQISFPSAERGKEAQRKAIPSVSCRDSRHTAKAKSDFSPHITKWNSEPASSPYRDLSPASQSQVQALTRSLTLVYATLDSEIAPFNLHDHLKSPNPCQLKCIKASFMLQRRTHHSSPN